MRLLRIHASDASFCSGVAGVNTGIFRCGTSVGMIRCAKCCTGTFSGLPWTFCVLPRLTRGFFREFLTSLRDRRVTTFLLGFDAGGGSLPSRNCVKCKCLFHTYTNVFTKTKRNIYVNQAALKY